MGCTPESLIERYHLTWREHLQFPTNRGGGCEGGEGGGAGGRHPVEEEPRVPLGGLGLPRHHLSVTFHVIKAGNTNNNINWHIIFIGVPTLPLNHRGADDVLHVLHSLQGSPLPAGRRDGGGAGHVAVGGGGHGGGGGRRGDKK